jgi:RNA polymerase sigma factor (sigma-70 family)
MLEYEGDNQAEQDLRDYIRLVIIIARQYVRTRVEHEDLIMAGVEGLLEARRKFDPSRSKNFKPYASIKILGHIYSYCQANSLPVSVPTHILKAASYIKKCPETK